MPSSTLSQHENWSAWWRRRPEFAVILAFYTLFGVALFFYLWLHPGSASGPWEHHARVEVNDPMALGSVGAPVVMVLYSDLLCSECAQFNNTTQPRLVEEYVNSGLLRIEWRNLMMHGEASYLAAKAGRAAAEQGRFWQFTNTLFNTETEGALTEEQLLEIAATAGVNDLQQFQSDLNSQHYDAELLADANLAEAAGIIEGPTIILNGFTSTGAAPFITIADKIDDLTSRNQWWWQLPSAFHATPGGGGTR